MPLIQSTKATARRCRSRPARHSAKRWRGGSKVVTYTMNRLRKLLPDCSKTMKPSKPEESKAKKIVNRLLEYDYEARPLPPRDTPHCHFCGGSTESLGYLKGRVHYRCTRCGMDASEAKASPAPGWDMPPAKVLPPAKASFYPSMGGPSSV